MNTNIYEHKPAKLETKQDLIDFIASIPDDRWCVNNFSDKEGRCCVNGHVGMAYYGDAKMFPNVIAGIPWSELAVQNNGGCLCADPSAPSSESSAIKARLIHYLQTGTYNPKL